MTRDEFNEVVDNLWDTPHGGTWSEDGGYRYFMSSGDAMGWHNANIGGGGSYQPHYSMSFGTGRFGYFKRSGLIGGPKFRWQKGNFKLDFSIEKSMVWVPNPIESNSPLFTPLEPTPWLNASIDGIYPQYSIRTRGLSRSTSTLRTVETSYKAINWGVTGAAFAMKYSRINTNIHYKVGSLTSFWKYYAPLKNTSVAMNASFVPYAFATWHLYDDIMSYQSGDIDEAELGFNTLTNYYGAYLSVSSGAAGLAWGAVYGAWIWGNREIYKNYLKPTFEGIYWHMYNLTHPY